MKTLAKITENLQAFESRFGMKVVGAPQLSEAWFQMKLGVISASNASKAVSGKDTETRLTYLCELAADVCTGAIEEMNFKQLEWGKEHEEGARSSYEFSTGSKLTQLGFVFKDDTFRVGCSPDGIVGPDKGMEAKCPWDSANYVKFLVADKMKSEWEWQNQFTMWVMGAEEWDVAQYDPRMKSKPLAIRTVTKDPKKHATFEDAIPQLIFDLDKMLAQIGVEFGSQWHRIAKAAVESVA